MNAYVRTALVSFSTLLFAITAAAQDDTCPAIVDQALTAADQACASIGRNQACYGNIVLSAIPREGAPTFEFNSPGDLVDVANVQTLALTALNVEENTWGVALMKIQANLPDTQPGQNVTFLLFGDVQIENAVETDAEALTLSAAANGAINVRAGASTNTGVVDSLAVGETITLDGRLEDSSWLHVQQPRGWVRADLVSVTGDVSTLTVLAPGEEAPPVYTPMQAFYFKTGIGDSACSSAPDSGILVQTPEGVGKITFRANDVDITLGSTAYLQAERSGDMTISVVEGEGTVSADGVTEVVPAGSQVSIPLDEDLSADGAPSEPQPYDENDFTALPVDDLPKAITVAPALTQEEIAAAAATPEPQDTPPAETTGEPPTDQYAGNYSPECMALINQVTALSESMQNGTVPDEATLLALAADIERACGIDMPTP